MHIKLVISLFFTLLANYAIGQRENSGFSVEPDTVPMYVEDYEDSADAPKANIFEGPPGRAFLYSMIVPGSGQIFNGSYWKAPIVWGVIGTMGTVMAYNVNRYNQLDDRYLTALEAEEMGDPNPDPAGLDASQLFDLRNQANKSKQLSIILFGFSWIGCAVESYVDAHLKEFDISDDLSIRLKPLQLGKGATYAQTGIAIRF